VRNSLLKFAHGIRRVAGSHHEAEISIEESQIPPGIRIILTVGEYQTKIFLDEYFLSKNPAEAIYKNFVILKREINDKKLSKSITIDPGEYL
jgi:hypothetical protein